VIIKVRLVFFLKDFNWIRKESGKMFHFMTFSVIVSVIYLLRMIENKCYWCRKNCIFWIRDIIILIVHMIYLLSEAYSIQYCYALIIINFFQESQGQNCFKNCYYCFFMQDLPPFCIMICINQVMYAHLLPRCTMKMTKQKWVCSVVLTAVMKGV